MQLDKTPIKVPDPEVLGELVTGIKFGVKPHEVGNGRQGYLMQCFSLFRWDVALPKPSKLKSGTTLGSKGRDFRLESNLLISKSDD